MAGRRSGAMERALQLFRRGGRTVTATAREAGVSVRQLRAVLREEGVAPLPRGRAPVRRR